MSYPIVHINGLPGVGKLTIARHLIDILCKDGSTTTTKATATAKLIHNHLLIDPASAVLDRTQEGYQDLRRELRKAVFKQIIGNDTTYETTYIFTDFQSGDEIGAAVCDEYKSLAASRGSPFVPIMLKCSEEVTLHRMTMPDRILHGKLTDVELARRFLRNQEPVFRFRHEAAFLELDVTTLSAEEAARRLAVHIRQFVPSY